MKEEIKKLWVAALRSGEYKQGKGLLINYKDNNPNSLYVPDEEALKNASYCCLGVLCDLYRKHTGKNLWKGSCFDDVIGIPSTTVVEWGGLSKANPFVKVDGVKVYISKLNDYGDYNFNQLADVIEKQL